MTAKYTGRPSYASRARRNNELHKHSSKDVLNTINDRLERLGPNQHFIIEPHEHMQLLEGTLRNRLSQINKRYGFNLKMHKDTNPNGKPNPNGNWYVWNCPDSRQFNRHGQPIDPNKPKLPKPSNKLSSGSIHATTLQVCEHLNMTLSAFDKLPFDRQMKLRIDTGIVLRDQRTKLAKLSRQFANPFNNTNKT